MLIEALRRLLAAMFKFQKQGFELVLDYIGFNFFEVVFHGSIVENMMSYQSVVRNRFTGLGFSLAVVTAQ